MGVTLNPFTGEFDITGGGGSSAGVSSIAKSGSAQLTGDVTLSEGTNVTLTQVGQNIEIAAAGASGAPSDAKYVTLATNATLTEERVLTGTANRISLTDNGAGSTVVVDIDAAYVGQASITTLGTIATGTWSATTIAVNKGGTGQTSYTDGQLLIGNTTGNTLAKATLTGTTSQVVVTNGNGSITLSTPQDINTSSSPTWVGETLTGNSTIAGYLRVGSNSAPTNTTAGDLTMVRLNLGNVAFGTGVEAAIGGDATISGFTRIGSGTAPTNTTAGDLTSARLKIVDGAFGTGVEFSVTGDGALSGFLRVGSETAPTNTTAGDLTSVRLKVGDGAFGTGVEFSVTGDGALSGFLGVGSETAPTNTTAGDLTATRLSIGNSAAFSGSAGYFVSLTGTMTDTSGTVAYMFVKPTTAPATNSTSTFQGINFILNHNPGAGVTTTGLAGGNFACFVHTTGTVGTSQGFLGNAIQITNAFTGAVTVTTAQGVVSLPGAIVSGTSTCTVTTMTGFDMNLGLVGNSSWTITNLYGLRISDLLATSNTITTFAGIRIDKLTKGTTNIYGAQILMPGLANGTGTMTDEYGYVTPTATVALSNQTATTTNQTVMSLGIQTYTSTTNTRTVTNAHTLYIEGAPVASTNVTFTNTAYALFVDSGPIRLDATSANNTVATVLGSVGPTGANTTVQEWLTITIGTNVRYLPCF